MANAIKSIANENKKSLIAYPLLHFFLKDLHRLWIFEVAMISSHPALNPILKTLIINFLNKIIKSKVILLYIYIHSIEFFANLRRFVMANLIKEAMHYIR